MLKVDIPVWNKCIAITDCNCHDVGPKEPRKRGSLEPDPCDVLSGKLDEIVKLLADCPPAQWAYLRF